MSLLDWADPNFLYQLRFLRPHMVNGRWYFLKRDIVLPYNYWPILENRLRGMIYRPPLMALPFTWFMKSTIFLRMSQANIDHIWTRLIPRGAPLTDFFGEQKRRVRFPVLMKGRDPYLHFQMAARTLRSRWFRTFGWSIPKKHGPGEGLGAVPRRWDYWNKLARMADDDYCDTGISIYFLRMFPTCAIRKYFNELPRPTPYWYGMDYTKEQMYNHIFWGIDPGTVIAEQEAANPDPAVLEARKKEFEYIEYLFPELVKANHSPDYKLRWPFPDDNVYRPTYNRGFNRQYWCRFPY